MTLQYTKKDQTEFLAHHGETKNVHPISLKLASINVKGIRSEAKQTYLWSFLRKHDIDVAAIQEFNATNINLPNKDYMITINYNDEGLGTAIIYKTKIPIKRITKSADGRVITLWLNNLQITNIYGYATGPNHSRNKANSLFRNVLTNHLDSKEENCILLGDFNATIDGMENKNINKTLHSVIHTFKFTDTFRHQNPEKLSNTFISKQGNSRIDRIYVTKTLMKQTMKTTHVNFYLSDHLAVILQLNTENLTTNQKRKSPFWILNTSILEHADFLSFIETWWRKQREKKKQYGRIVDWWENAKNNFKEIAITYCKQLSKEKKSELEYLERCLEQVKIELDTGKAQIGEYLEIKAELKELFKQKIRGQEIRSKINNPIPDEQGNLQFVLKERSNKEGKEIIALKNQCGKLVKTEDEKATVIQNFYTNLFTLEKKETDKGERYSFLKNLKRHLNQQNETGIVAPLTTEEIKTAIKSMPANKTPGSDGLPAEFYQKFLKLIGNDLRELYDEILKTGEMSRSQKTSSIILIHKGEERSELKNWRPISLLGCDYKILAKILTNRLKPVLQDIIGPNQTGGLTDRNITENLCNIRNTILHIENNKPERKNNLAIIALDFEKAYDRVDRDFIYEVMRKVKIPEMFINWIKTLYEDSTARVILNDKLGQPIKISRGVKQGCPLALYLYLLYIEPLLATIEKNIDGVKIGPASIKTSGYVDDVVIIASSDYDLTTTIEILAKFEKMTNSRLNRNKCSALTFGTWKTEDNWPQTWLKRVNKLKILGITFKHTLNETIKENCKMLKKTFTKAVLSTSNRNFTLLQKTFYTNTYLIPIVSFLAKILLIPKKTARQLQGILNKYIWSGTLEKLKQKETFAKVKDGGTGTVNLENKTESLFIATFIKQFMKNGTEPTTKVLNYWTSISLKTLREKENCATAENVPKYFQKTVEKIKHLGKIGLITKNKIPTPKILYNHFIQDSIKPPKILKKKPFYDFKTIFQNISSSLIKRKTKQFMFNLTHDILPTKQRLKRLKLATTDTCYFCTEIETTEHIFNCPASQPATKWIMRKLLTVQQNLEQKVLHYEFQSKGKLHCVINWIAGTFGRLLWEAREQKNGNKILHQVSNRIKTKVKFVKDYYSDTLQTVFYPISL